MIRALRLHHASIRVRDLERSREFYEGLLGMSATDRPDLGFPGTWYGLGAGQLHLMELAKGLEGIDPTDPHFAVEVEDFEATKEILREQKIDFREIGPAIWILDPDGYVVELRAPGATGAGRLPGSAEPRKKMRG